MRFNERRFLRELEQEERRKRNRAEAESVIAEQGKKVIIGAIVTGAGFPPWRLTEPLAQEVIGKN